MKTENRRRLSRNAALVSAEEQGQRIGGSNRSIWFRIRKDYQLYILVLPALIWYAIFAYAPMYGLQIAFKDYIAPLGFTGSPWVGLKYFRSFFRTPYAWQIIKNTFVLALYGMVASMPLPIIMSLMINELRNQKFKKFTQTVLYAPHFISTVVLVGMLNIFFTPSGIINIARHTLGLETVNYMMLPAAFRHLYVWSGVWQQTGWNCIIYLAALAGIDPGLYEAATLDGASRFQKILHINLPAIMPTAMILLIMNSGNLLTVGFDKVFLMSNDLNIAQSNVLSLYIYQRGIVSNDFGFSTAVGLLNGLVSLVLVLLVNWITKKITDTSLF